MWSGFAASAASSSAQRLCRVLLRGAPRIKPIVPRRKQHQRFRRERRNVWIVWKGLRHALHCFRIFSIKVCALAGFGVAHKQCRGQRLLLG